jgi:tRNA dimethylallyltransferase
VFIVGPTASGKSALALQLAQAIGGEIVCADSQTIRKELTIGTAKPSDVDRRLVTHYMLDIIDPYATYSVANFVSLARKCIADIQKNGKIPIIVGGSGLYIDALFFGYQFSESTENEDFSGFTVEQLQNEIVNRKLTLPKNASNPRHLLGVLRRGPEHENDRKKPIDGAYIFGLRWPEQVLKERIAQRIEKMFDEGFIEELHVLLKKYGEPPHTLDAIGYPIGMRHIQGKISLEEAKELFRRGDWQYARKQLAWFKRNSFIRWLDPSEQTVENILEQLEQD